MPESSAIYLLDANVFIEAHRRYYGLDLCPGFWECLTHFCEAHQVTSIDRVRSEVEGEDALGGWIGDAPHDLFASSADNRVIDRFAEMINWVQANDQFFPAAKAEFARVADGWVAAYASVHGAVVVTQEVYNPAVRKRVPLPNVCHQFQVSYLNTFEMLRALDVRFSWAP